MSHPINLFGRVAQTDLPVRQNAVQGDKGASEATASPMAAPGGAGKDEVKLSEVARQAMQEPGFDRAKVDAIKAALQEGRYPLDSRRIAESFVAIERMIKD